MSRWISILHIHYLLLYYTSNEVGRLLPIFLKHTILDKRHVRRSCVTWRSCVFSFCDIHNYHWNLGFLSWNIIEKSLKIFRLVCGNPVHVLTQWCFIWTPWNIGHRLVITSMNCVKCNYLSTAYALVKVSKRTIPSPIAWWRGYVIQMTILKYIFLKSKYNYVSWQVSLKALQTVFYFYQYELLPTSSTPVCHGWKSILCYVCIICWTNIVPNSPLIWLYNEWYR